MRPVHFLSEGFMLTRIFSPFGTAYPQRFWPHCSMRTIPLLFSVFHMPSGVVGASIGAAATACSFGAAATAGSFAAAGEATDAIFSLTFGADKVEATSVAAVGVLLLPYYGAA